jgi:hypothetical protein
MTSLIIVTNAPKRNSWRPALLPTGDAPVTTRMFRASRKREHATSPLPCRLARAQLGGGTCSPPAPTTSARVRTAARAQVAREQRGLSDQAGPVVTPSLEPGP